MMPTNKEEQFALDRELEQHIQVHSEQLYLESDVLRSLQMELKKFPQRFPRTRPFWQQLWFHRVALPLAGVAAIWSVIILMPEPHEKMHTVAPVKGRKIEPKQKKHVIHKKGHVRKSKKPITRRAKVVKRAVTNKMIPKGISFSLMAIGQATGYQKKVKVKNGEVLYEGDQIQIQYHFPRKMHMMVASINQKGEVSIFAPLSGKKSMMTPKEKGHFAPLELDDYIGLERIVAFASETPFEASSIKKHLQQAFQKAGKDLLLLKQVDGEQPIAWTVLLNKQKTQ